MAFGALFSKTWRVYQIFTNIKMGKKPVKDGQLMIFVFSLLFINVAVLVIWELLDPRRITVVEVGREESGDFTIITRIEECRSDNQIIFTGILLAIQCLLMLLGSFLAFETRKVCWACVVRAVADLFLNRFVITHTGKN